MNILFAYCGSFIMLNVLLASGLKTVKTCLAFAFEIVKYCLNDEWESNNFKYLCTKVIYEGKSYVDEVCPVSAETALS